MATIYQFNCSNNETIIAFSTDKTGMNIPTGDKCTGEWVLYVDNIIKETPDSTDENYQKILKEIEANGWHITTSQVK
jgi:effector-binding domain-containing protein